MKRTLGMWMVLSLFGFATGAGAAVLYKDVTTTDINTVANWSTTSGASTPDPASIGTGDELRFNEYFAPTSGTSYSVDLSGDLTVGCIRSDSGSGGGGTAFGNVIINSAGSKTLTLNGTGDGTYTTSGIVMNSGTGGTLTINCALALGASQTFTTSRALTIGGGLNIGAFNLSNNVAGGTSTFSSTVTGSGNISKSGAGTLVLSANNAASYSGTTSISAGTLALNNAGALGTGALTITGGTIDNSSAAAITLSTNNAQNWNGDFTFAGTKSLDLGTGAVTMSASRQVTVSANTLTVGGIIGGSGFSLTKAGAGSLVLNGANTYSGGTTVSAGYLQFGSGAVPSTGTITVNGNGSLNAAGAYTTVQGWLDSGKVGTASTGSIAITAASSENINFSTGGYNDLALSSYGSYTYSGTITPGSNGYLFGGDTGGTLTVSSLTSSGTAIKKVSSAGNVTISSLTINADTTISGTGTADRNVRFTIGALTAGANKLTIGSGGLVEIALASRSGTIDINNGGVLYFEDGTTSGTATGTITVKTGGKLEGRDFDNNGAASARAITLDGGAIGNATITSNNGGGGGTRLKNNITVTSNGGTLTGSNTSFGIYLRLSGALSGSGALTANGTKGVQFQGDTSGYTGTLTGSNGDISFNPSSGTQTFNGVIAGSRPLIKNGAGTTVFTKVNTYSGNTTISGGTLKIDAGSVIYADSYRGVVLTVSSGAALELQNWAYDQSASHSMSLGGLTANATGMVVSNGTIRVVGTTATSYGRGVTVNSGGATLEAGTGANWTIDTVTDSNAWVFNTNPAMTLTGAGTGTFQKALTNGTGTLTKSGTGIWTLSGANTYTGATSITGGTLKFAKQVSLYNNTPASWTAANLTVASGATAAFNVGGTGEFTSSDIDTIKALTNVASGTPATQGFKNGSRIGFDTTNAGGTFTYATQVANHVAGSTTDTLGVVKLGTGTLVLSASNNSYTGGNYVYDGTLQLASSGSGVTTLSGGNLTLASGLTYSIDNGLTFASNTAATVSAVSGTATIKGFDVNSADIIVNSGVSASIASSVGIDSGSTYAHRFDLTGDLTIAGVISGTPYVMGQWSQSATPVGTDKFVLFKRGAGTLTLTGASTVTGSGGNASFSIEQGDLKLSGGNNRLPTVAAVYLGGTQNYNARLVLDGINQTLSGLQGAGSGTLAVVGSSATLSTLTVNNTQDYSFSGKIGGTGTNEDNLALTKSGAGKLTLSGTSSFTGGTTITGGTLALGHATDTLTGAVTVSGGELSIAGNSDTVGAVTLTDGSITGTGGTLTGSSYDVRKGSISAILGGSGIALTKSTGDTVTLSGLNTYTGATTINAGTLAISGVGAVGGTSGIGLATGGMLEYTGAGETLGKNITVSSGTGYVSNTGGGTLTLGGTLDKTGTTLTLSGIINVTGSITGTNGSYNSDLVVNGGVTTLSSANTYEGPTYIRNGGTLNANVLNALPTANGRTAVIMDDVGTGSSLVLGAAQSIASLTGAASSMVNLDKYPLTVGTTSGTTTFAGVISGGETGKSIFYKDGGSTLVLTGDSTFEGEVHIDGGTLSIGKVANLGARGTGRKVIFNNGGTLHATDNMAGDKSTEGDHSAFQTRHFVFETNASGETYAGVMDVDSGKTMEIRAQMTGSGGLKKSGAGTLMIASSVAAAYTGDTSVVAGVLELDGSLASEVTATGSGTQVTGNGGTFGSGLILASSAVLSPGTPGDSTGTLTISSSTLTLNSGTIVNIDIGTTLADFDQIAFTGTSPQLWLNGATLNVTLGYDAQVGDSFVIFKDFAFDTTGSPTSRFNTMPQDYQFDVTYNSTNYKMQIDYLTGNDITLTVIPEPGTAGIVATFLAAALLRRRRRAE